MSKDKITLEEAQKVVEQYKYEHEYVCRNIQHFMNNDFEPTDNSIELADYYNECKRIVAIPSVGIQQTEGVEAKAKELVERFKKELSWLERDYKVDLWRDSMQCALICVDEILETRLLLDEFSALTISCSEQQTLKFWLRVKEAITKL